MRRLTFLLFLLVAGPAKAEVATSILPLQAWAEELLGPDARVQVLVGPGQSPALFEPTGRQLAELSRAGQLFVIGVPFEAALLPRIGRMFPSIAIIELGRTIRRQDWPDAHAHGTAEGPDPHIWLDPMNAVALIGEMATELAGRRVGDADSIQERARGMQERFTALDLRLDVKLRPLRGQELLAYHPALGYFATAYGLRQAAVESGGTEPGARHLSQIAERMQAQTLRVLVVEPQFAPHRARSLAETLDLQVVLMDPLARDLVSELDAFADRLIASLGERP